MPKNLQFIHLSSYGETPGRGQPPYATIRGVIAEALRSTGNAPHVAFSREPVQLFGTEPLKIADQACELLSLARDRIGRRLRKSCVGLVAGVVTYPIPKSDMGGFVSDYDFYNLWEQLTLDFLQQEHGSSLQCVLRHEDETHLHLHFYTLPTLTDGGRLDFRQAHPGRHARAEAVERGVCSAARDAAYTNAVMGYQDRYHASVSQRFGHERVGPGRKRVDRNRHKANRSATEHVERVRAELELDYRVQVSEVEADARSSRIGQVEFIAVAVERERRLKVEIARLQAEKKQLEAEIRNLHQRNDKNQVSEILAGADIGESHADQHLIESLALLAQLEPQPEEALSAVEPNIEVEPSVAHGFFS